MFTPAGLAGFALWFALGVVLVIPVFRKGDGFTRATAVLALGFQLFAVVLILGRGGHHPPPMPPEDREPEATAASEEDR